MLTHASPRLRRSARQQATLCVAAATAHLPRFFVSFFSSSSSSSGRRRGRNHHRQQRRKQQHEHQLWTPYNDATSVDMLKPHLWFPAAREMRRKIFLHVGPTNSGKTHHAVERLKASASGVYCAPLRLLAWEIFERLGQGSGRPDEDQPQANDALLPGLPCNLRTGQEKVLTTGAMHTACTVEMTDVRTAVDCAVVDEIQNISDPNRGWAWTHVLLGLPAREIHACGDPASVALVQRLCAEMGEDVEVIHYDRKSPLQVARKSLPGLHSVEAGDCVIAFSRKEIHRLKQEIEIRSNFAHKCCMVYGSLPPETRRDQAKLFNEPGWREGEGVVGRRARARWGVKLPRLSRCILSTCTYSDM